MHRVLFAFGVETAVVRLMPLDFPKFKNILMQWFSTKKNSETKSGEFFMLLKKTHTRLCTSLDVFFENFRNFVKFLDRILENGCKIYLFFFCIFWRICWLEEKNRKHNFILKLSRKLHKQYLNGGTFKFARFLRFLRFPLH